MVSKVLLVYIFGTCIGQSKVLIFFNNVHFFKKKKKKKKKKNNNNKNPKVDISPKIV